MNPLNPYFGKTFQIKSQSRFLDSNLSGKESKKYIWQAVFCANLLILFAVLFLSQFHIMGNSGKMLLHKDFENCMSWEIHVIWDHKSNFGFSQKNAPLPGTLQSRSYKAFSAAFKMAVRRNPWTLGCWNTPSIVAPVFCPVTEWCSNVFIPLETEARITSKDNIPSCVIWQNMYFASSIGLESRS